MTKKLVGILLLWTLSLFCLPSFAFTQEDIDAHAYFGIDLERRNLRFEDNFGDNLFKNELNQYNTWIALQVFRYFGIGVGYDNANRRNRTNILNEGESYLGIFLAPGDGIETHLTETKIKGTHVELLGFYPICPRFMIDVIGSLGVARNKLSLTDFFIAQDNILLSSPIVRTYDDKKSVARASLGLQMIIYKYFGARAQVIWENNSRFNGLKPIESPAALTNVNLRDSYIYSIGLFVTI